MLQHRQPTHLGARPCSRLIPQVHCIRGSYVYRSHLDRNRTSVTPSIAWPQSLFQFAGASCKCAAAAASTGASPAPDAPPATNAFLRVVLPTALALMLCNMDRICMSVAIMPMSQEFGWPASLQGVIQSAFLWGYMATQLLGGTLADKYGGRRVVAAGILWFSLASALLPLAASQPIAAAGLTIPAVLLARCLVGLGEGVVMPSMNSLVANYIPPAAKARALGMAFSGFHSGNLLGLILSPWLLINYGWRGLFYIFGFIGAPLLAFWLVTVPKQPMTGSAAAAEAGRPSVPQIATSSSSGSSSGASSSGREASDSRSKVTLWAMMSKPATWAIIIVNFINHFGFFIYLNWMPTYFSRALGFDLRASSFLSFLPWLVMALGSTGAGFLADGMVAKGMDTAKVRKLLQTVAFLVPAVALMVLASPGISKGVAVGAMTVALGVTSLGQAGFVANMADIAPKHAGQMFGLANTFGCVAGILGVVAVGLVVEATGSFTPVFQLTAAMYVFGVVVWNLLCTAQPVF